MNSVGIVQKSPSHAAAFIETNYSSINQWWNSEPVQHALDLLRSDYLLPLDNTFAKRWADALRALVN